jgi:hypothetical protein
VLAGDAARATVRGALGAAVRAAVRPAVVLAGGAAGAAVRGAFGLGTWVSHDSLLRPRRGGVWNRFLQWNSVLLAP